MVKQRGTNGRFDKLFGTAKQIYREDVSESIGPPERGSHAQRGLGGNRAGFFRGALVNINVQLEVLK